jgi:serine/threonine-protein kinase
VDRVRAAAKKHARLAGSAGPTDPDARNELERGVAAMNRFILPHVQEGIAILEAALVKHPGEPHLMAQLGSGLIRAWGQTGARDAAMFARAEELSLRAIEADPDVHEAYATISSARLLTGELRAAVRATNEVLRRDPMHAGSHLQLGRLLCESGHVGLGMQRLELAARIQPSYVAVHMERARTHALMGDRAAAEHILAEGIARGGPLSMLVLQTRLAVWWNDRALARATADLIEAQSSGASWERAADIMRAIERAEPLVDLPSRVTHLMGVEVLPRHRNLMGQIVTEYMALIGHREPALAALESSAALPSVDLLWVDRSPPLAPLRGDPRFAQARAIIAARAAELWG